MSKSQNTFRTSFLKLSPADQLRVLKKFISKGHAVKDSVDSLTRVNPYVSIRQNGVVSLLTDKHLLS